MNSSEMEGFFDSSILSTPSNPDEETSLQEANYHENDLPPLPTVENTLLREKELYERALDVYEEILDNGNLKLQKDAAKEIVAVYHKRLEHDSRLRRGNSNIIAIGNDALREALQRAANGIEGGFANAPERTAHPIGLAAERLAAGDEE